MNELVKIVPLVVFIYKWIINTTSELVKKYIHGARSLIVLQPSGVSGDGPKLEVPHLTPYIKMFV